MPKFKKTSLLFLTIFLLLTFSFLLTGCKSSSGEEMVKGFIFYTEKGQWNSAIALTDGPLKEYLSEIKESLEIDRQYATVDFSEVQVWPVPNRSDLWRAKYHISRKGVAGAESYEVIMEYQLLKDKIVMMKLLRRTN